MAGGATSGALIMTFGTMISVPYGGVLAAGHLGGPLLVAAAVAVGVVVTAGATVALKSLRRSPAPAAPATARPSIARIRTADESNDQRRSTYVLR